MKFDKLTQMEEIALNTFKELWHERDLNPIYINEEKEGLCVCKENGEWISFDYARGKRYYLHNYDSMSAAIEKIYSFLDKANKEYCMSKYPELLKDNLENKPKHVPKYVKYEDLEDEEKTILDAFIKLLKEKKEFYLNVVYPQEYEVNKYQERITFYKLDNKWVSYILERNQKSGYREYDDLYTLCMDIFNSLEKSHSDYHLDIFPILVEDIKKNYSKTKSIR